MFRQFFRSIPILLASVAALTVSCQSTTNTAFVKDGVDYASTRGIFHGRWWNYYERGVNLLGGGFYEAAADNFRKAVNGRSRDTWQARTYGLHFVEYFPNRELAVALQAMGELEESEIYLARSLEQMDTARGHHYLDLVRQQKIAQGMMADTSAPDLQVSLRDRQLVAELDLNLPITASDDTGVRTLRVNGQELYQRGSRESIAYRKSLSFTEGTHRIVIEAVDLAGKVTTIERDIVVDFTGPNIGIREPDDGLITKDSSVRLAGTTVDLNGVREISLDGRILASSEGGQERVPFETTLSLEDGQNTFTLVSIDMAGNETETDIVVYRGDPDSLSARLWKVEYRNPGYLQVAAANAGNFEILLSVVEAAQEEATGPQIKIKSPKEGLPWRNHRAITVAGKVSADVEVAKILVNGVEVAQLTGEKVESFSRRILVDEELLDEEGNGRIEVAVVANDSNGNEARQEVAVDVQPVALETRASKMPVAILAFGGADGSDLPGELRTVTEFQVSQSKRFNLLERERLADILSELQLSEALADPTAALQLGKLLPVHVFITADVIKRGSQAEIIARAILTETSEIVFQADAHIENTEDSASITEACMAIVEQLKQGFPRISGTIKMVAGGKVITDLTEADGLVEGTHMLVVVRTEDLYDDGELIMEGFDESLGEIVITRIRPDGVIGVPVAEEEAEFEKGMAVITM